MKKIELQLAMDGAATRTLDQAMEIIDRVAPYLDIIEIGTSFVLRYGMEPVSRVKAAHPDKKILADMKVMDGGYHNCGHSQKEKDKRIVIDKKRVIIAF